jgi:hypothetical protein
MSSASDGSSTESGGILQREEYRPFVAVSQGKYARVDLTGCRAEGNTVGDDDSEPGWDLLLHVLYGHAWGIRAFSEAANAVTQKLPDSERPGSRKGLGLFCVCGCVLWLRFVGGELWVLRFAQDDNAFGWRSLGTG